MINKSFFGKTSAGEEVFQYTITNTKGMSVSLIDYGAVIRSICLKDRTGELRDVVLGFDSVLCYEEDNTYCGAVIGRYANRIGGAGFSLNQIRYNLDKNDGENHLHGGFNGYNKRVWKSDFANGEAGNSVVFELQSPDMDQGYPGNLTVKVCYTLTEDNSLVLDYYAVSDRDTICNLVNHVYFNLGGHDSGTALNEMVWIDADYFTEADEHSIPTGRLLPVRETPMDFTNETVIGERIDNDYYELVYGAGYDHNYVLKNEGRLTKVASLRDTKTGIRMETFTDLPGMQFYSGNFLKPDIPGKKGARYERRSGVCFETQVFPDSINKPDFPSPIIKAGEQFHSTTEYKFSV